MVVQGTCDLGILPMFAWTAPSLRLKGAFLLPEVAGHAGPAPHPCVHVAEPPASPRCIQEVAKAAQT